MATLVCTQVTPPTQVDQPPAQVQAQLQPLLAGAQSTVQAHLSAQQQRARAQGLFKRLLRSV